LEATRAPAADAEARFLLPSSTGRASAPHRVMLLPPETHPAAARLLCTRGLRAFGDGYVSLLLPFYLSLLGFSALEVGIIVSATLLSSASLTLSSFGWLLVICGTLKIIYDLTLLRMFGQLKPPEEADNK
jgi:hypothetical protein